ncbi:hypothetical protein Tco_1209148 [Tanacetum coccineum]
MGIMTQLLIAQKEEAGIQLQAKEFDLMVDVGDIDEIEDVNANCVLMANLQQASTSGIQIGEAPVFDSDGTSEFIPDASSVEQSGGTVDQNPATAEEIHAHFESLYNNLATKVERVNMVNRKMRETNADLTTELARYKTNPDSFYHIEQKMALGYPNPHYLKKAQQKQQSLYNGSVLLEKHDPLVVYDSEETLQLAQESRLKMKQLNKEIKLANYAKNNKFSEVFVSQNAKSREQGYFSNTSKTANVSKLISLPNEEYSDDTLSIARKFLNEVKDTPVTLQRVVKHRMNGNITNLSSSTHQEIHKIFKDEIVPIVKQVDVGRLQAQLGDLKSKSSNTQCASNTLDHLSRKLKDENVSLEFHVNNDAKENAHLKTTYKNLFDSINVTRGQTKGITYSLKNKLNDMIYENTKLRAQLFDKVSEQKNTTKSTSVNTQFSKQSILGKPPSYSQPKLYSVTPFLKSMVSLKGDETNALLQPVTSNSTPST